MEVFKFRIWQVDPDGCNLKRGGGYVTNFTECKAVGSHWLLVRDAKVKLRDVNVCHRTCPEEAMQLISHYLGTVEESVAGKFYSKIFAFQIVNEVLKLLTEISMERFYFFCVTAQP